MTYKASIRAPWYVEQFPFLALTFSCPQLCLKKALFWEENYKRTKQSGMDEKD